MTSTSNLRLDRLSLRNFRCFSEVTVDLHPNLTVLVAENGCGKTAILDAIGIALGLFVDTIAGAQQNGDFRSEDIHLVHGEDGKMIAAPPVEYLAEGFVAGQQASWGRALNVRNSTKDAESLLQAVRTLQYGITASEADQSKPQPMLPLVALYGTGRLWNREQPMEGRRDRGPLSGYIDCLSPNSSFESTIDWYGSKMSEIADPSSRDHSAIRLITAVETAMRAVLRPTGWCSLDWDSAKGRVIVEHTNGDRLHLSALSDGIRNMVALVMDIARRCAILNPHFGEEAASRTPGVLLIDEVDMHLHPSWQQRVVSLLQEAFPAMQLVMTTHSPHVLSTVDMESIRKIQVQDGQGLLETPEFQTRGVESADILAHIMYVDPIPHIEEAQWVSDYKALVQTGKHKTESGQEQWERLLRHFGSDHPVIHDVETLCRLQDFKMLHNLSQTEGA